MHASKILDADDIVKLLHRFRIRFRSPDIISSGEQMTRVETYADSGLVFDLVDDPGEVGEGGANNVRLRIGHVFEHADYAAADFFVSFVDGICDGDERFVVGARSYSGSRAISRSARAWHPKGNNVLPIVQLQAQLLASFQIVHKALVTLLPLLTYSISTCLGDWKEPTHRGYQD